MSNSFDVNAYWLARGRDYDSETRLAGDYHRLQQLFLLDVLNLSRLPTGRLLEIGCGFGRVTRVLAEAFPASQITALDLSPEQLQNARTHCAGLSNVSFAPYDLYSGLPLPGGPFDVTLASEVFLHHPGARVRQFVQHLAASSRFLVNIDWCEDWQGPVSEHVWIHNFRAIYEQAGLQSAGFPLPQRIDGKQQRLFIAGRELPEALIRLERFITYYGCDSAEPPWKAEDQTPRAQPPQEWKTAVQTAANELRALVPEGATAVVADDGQWPDASLLGKRHILPFLEQDGLWWGPPADDDVAIAELERLRQAGADWFVLAWPAFWWMEHYARFLQYLRQRFPCVLQNDRLLVFHLRPGAKR